MRRWTIGFLALVLKINSVVPSAIVRKFILKYIFRMNIAKKCAIYSSTEFKAPWKISIGNCTSIASGCIIDGRRGIIIGNNVTVAFNVMIWSLAHDHQSRDFRAIGASVIINDYVWLCSSCILLPGVVIGKGAVVAAGAVVTKNVEEYTVVGGNPAKPIGKRSKDLEYCSGEWELPFV